MTHMPSLRSLLPRSRAATSVLLATAAIAVFALSASAQESMGLPQASALAQQSLRPYWHVFAAYTIVIVMVGGWAISIARRLRGIEKRLVD